LPIHIRVNSNGTIDTLTVRITASLAGSSCTGTVVRTALPVAADGTFQTKVGLGFSTTLHGRFTSATGVSGSIEPYDGPYGIACGALIAIGSGPAIAAVQWQGQKQ